MRWRRVLCGSIALIASRARALDSASLDGWHPCSMDIGESLESTADVQAECATVAMPLCHGDVCSGSENSTVEVFVKRIPANSASSTRNLWFLPDHPFAMSVHDAERQMVLLHQELLGDVNVYLMDQRGTGRGTLFDCEASQATSPTSPQGVLVAPSEVKSCADALRTAFGDSFAPAFSLTSAARDVVTFISTFQAQTKVFLYGVGFGTLLVERMMHFPSEEIIGFVVDSTATTSGAKKKEFPFRSRADKDFGAVFKAFLAVCDDDASCSQRFNGEKLEHVVQDVLTAIDEVNATCSPVAKALRASSTEPASYNLRRVLAAMLQQISLRPFIPVVVHRLARCTPSDVDVLNTFISRLQALLDAQLDKFTSASSAGAAMLVYDLIVFSEMWEDPPPSERELLSRFTKTLASRGTAYSELERYCAFTQDATTACSGFTTEQSVSPLSYARDSNWNEPSKIKEQASVLFLASRFDGHAPLAYTQTLFSALEGDDNSKQLLVFEAAAHNVLVQTPPLVSSDGEDRSLDASPSCSRSVLAIFIDNDGDLAALDVSCMQQLPKNVSLSISEALSMDVLGVTDAYDGFLPTSPSHSGSGSSSSSDVAERPVVSIPHQNSSADATSLASSRDRYRTAFIVMLVLVLLLLVVVVVLLYRARKKRLLEAEELQLRKMRGEEEDDMEFLRDLYNPSPTEWFNYRSNRIHL